MQWTAIVRGKIVDNAQVNGISLALLQLLGFSLKTFYGGKEFHHGLMKDHSFMRQTKAAASALTEAKSNPRLQLGHMVADG